MDEGLSARVATAHQARATPIDLPPVKMVEDWFEQNRMLSEFVCSAVPRDRTVRILEAGCGTQWPLKLTGVDYSLTGLDLDRNALDIRMRTHGDLDETIHGDLRTAEFQPESFDVIYNAFVLEHVDGAEGVMDNFMAWLKPGGLLVLRIPNRDSVFGFVTRSLPFWCHVLFTKYVERIPNAGKPGHDPYPTYYDAIVSRKGMNAYCRKRGLDVELEMASSNWGHLGRLKDVLFAFMRIVEYASLGRLSTEQSGLTYIIRKPAARR
jgi:SAM-dependent methyltransferase